MKKTIHSDEYSAVLKQLVEMRKTASPTQRAPAEKLHVRIIFEGASRIDPQSIICNSPAMTLIDQHKTELREACKTFQVRELYAFGSVLTDRFAEKSDVDLAVDFNRSSFEGSFQQFVGFKAELEKIFQRHVDLVPFRNIRNPIFRNTLEKTRQCVYAA